MPAVTPVQPVLCLGCAIGLAGGVHRCAGDRELLPYGGYCGCDRPGCGPGQPAPGRRGAREQAVQC